MPTYIIETLPFAHVATPEMLGPHLRAFGINRAALLSGVEQAWIRKWLRHKKAMSLDKRLQLAKAIGMVITIRVAPRRTNRGYTRHQRCSTSTSSPGSGASPTA